MNGLCIDEKDQKPVKRGWPLFLLLLSVGLFHLLTMPESFYPGDNYTSRAECANLINSGELGIDYSHKKVLGGFLESRGQYFYENDAKQRMYSKYGIGYTLVYLVPLMAEKLYTGQLDLMCGTRSQLVFINIYNILFVLGATAYFYAIASLYTVRTWRKIIFILISYYATFAWHYLRSPTTEVFQLLPFLGYYYHMAQFLRGARQGLEGNAKGWKHLGLAVCFAGVLTSMKLFFVLLFMVSGLCSVMMPGWTGMRGCVRNGIDNLWKYKSKYFAYLIVPSLIIMALLLWLCHYKFGSVFETGYGQWQRKGGGTHETFKFGKNMLIPIEHFFIKRGNANAFIHYPFFVFSWFGLRRFFKKFPVDIVFIALLFGVTVVTLLSFSSWSGAWCYGPRYLLFILMIGSLPFLEVMDALVALSRRFWKWCFIGVMTLVLGWSLLMQVYINSLHYFSFYYLTSVFEQFKQERIKTYFNCFHRGLIHRDLVRYVNGSGSFLPVHVIEEIVPYAQREQLVSVLKMHLTRMAEPNYLVFDKGDEGAVRETK